MKQRPNILMIMTDQHRADWLGCTGHPVVSTPNIDSLASRGTLFSNFHVTSPVCMPNRGAIFTGRYPSANRLRHNGLPLPAETNTFVDLLRGAGYRTASIGKSHLQPFGTAPVTRADEVHAANCDFPEPWRIEGQNHGYEDPANYAGTEEFPFPRPYYGFDHVRMVTGHSDECGGHYLQWLRRQRPDDWSILRNRANQMPHNYSCPQAVRTAIPEELYPTAFIRDEARSYLQNHGDSDEPFFAFVSFPDPHHPFTPPGRYWDMYDPDDFTVDLPYEAHRNPPPHLRACKEMFDAGRFPDNQQQSFMASDRMIREAMALTAGMISMIDDAVGDILRTLEETGQADDTIVIFNADHGDYMGAFSLLLKGPFPHHTVNRVPFIWFDPAEETTSRAEGLAASVDIAPTILERCGITPYYGMQGRSFLGQTRGEPSARDFVLIEHEENKVYPGFDQRPNMRHVITHDRRLTVCKGLDYGELFDLSLDPDETCNLWKDPAAAEMKSEMMFRLSQAMFDAVERAPWPRRLA